jgi:hypothetical protein
LELFHQKQNEYPPQKRNDDGGNHNSLVFSFSYRNEIADLYQFW